MLTFMDNRVKEIRLVVVLSKHHNTCVSFKVTVGESLCLAMEKGFKRLLYVFPRAIKALERGYNTAEKVVVLYNKDQTGMPTYIS